MIAAAHLKNYLKCDRGGRVLISRTSGLGYLIASVKAHF